MKPLAIDLFSGLGGWAEGFLAEGYDVIGFDNGHTAPYAAGAKYPGQLVIQDVLTLHGSQFKNATVIVASPPCQNYSYLAMPWSRSKPEVCKSCGGKGKYPKIAEALGMQEIPCIRCGGRGTVEHSQKAKAMRRKWETEGPDNRLFDACFRIQREAIEARHLQVCCGPKRPTSSLALNTHGQTGMASNASAVEFDRQLAPGTAVPDTRRKPSEATAMQCKGECYIPLIVENVRGAIPWVGRSAWNSGPFHLWGDVPALMPTGAFKKCGGGWFGKGNDQSRMRKHSSRSAKRRLETAMISKVPFDLAAHIARIYRPCSSRIESAA